MPTLPTFDVTDNQANRMIAVFGSPEAYVEWLKTTIVEYVLAAEEKEIRAQFEEEYQERIAQGRADLLAG